MDTKPLYSSPPRSARFTVAVAAVMLAFFAALNTPAAHAVTVSSGPTVILSKDYAGATDVTYTFSSYRTDATNSGYGANERCTGFEITFPTGTNVTAATLVSPAGSRTISGQTVRGTFTTAIPRSTEFSIVLGGITNSAANTYNIGNIKFSGRRSLFGLFDYDSPSDASTGPYTIFERLFLTITTPDAGQTLDFGGVDPGVTTAAKSVTVKVDSSAGYTITRSIGGSVAELGLTVAGSMAGTKPAGTAEYINSFTLDPPWTTDPGNYTANVTYTVVQQ